MSESTEGVGAAVDMVSISLRLSDIIATRRRDHQSHHISFKRTATKMKNSGNAHSEARRDHCIQERVFESSEDGGYQAGQAR